MSGNVNPIQCNLVFDQQLVAKVAVLLKMSQSFTLYVDDLVARLEAVL